MNLKKQKSLGLLESILMGKVPHITGFWEEGRCAGKPDSEPILMDIDILEHHLVDQKWWLPLLQDGQGQRWRRWLEKGKKENWFSLLKVSFFWFIALYWFWCLIFFIEKSPLIQRTSRLEIVRALRFSKIPTSLICSYKAIKKFILKRFTDWKFF